MQARIQALETQVQEHVQQEATLAAKAGKLEAEVAEGVATLATTKAK